MPLSSRCGTNDAPRCFQIKRGEHESALVLNLLLLLLLLKLLLKLLPKLLDEGLCERKRGDERCDE
jgi:hypothetical protein